MPYMLPRSSSVKLDANGNGQVVFVIDNTNQRWVIDSGGSLTDQAPGSTPIPRCDVYQGQVTNEAWRGGTYNGARDQFTGRFVLYPDDSLIFAWTGGVPGSTATGTISGTFDPAGVPLSDG